jgi:hypothetical protein
MGNDSIKFLVYAFVGHTFRVDRQLSTELCDELIANHILASREEWKEYVTKEFKNTLENINILTPKEFNDFITNIITYCKINFDEESGLFLAYKIFSYLSVCDYKFFKKFKNPQLVEILKKF